MSIKLNAQSGGSVALDAPTQTTSSADLTFKLPVADGSTGQYMKTDGSGNLSFATVATPVPGITAFDQWYLTSAITNNGTISSNLSRTATAGSAVPLGSGMSQSSGIWTFPNTGIWQIVFNIRFQIDGSDNVDVVMQVTTDGGSNYSSVTHAVSGLNGSGSREATGSSMYFLDVTDVSQVKVRFQVTSISGSSNVTGTSIPITNFNFIRIGDT